MFCYYWYIRFSYVVTLCYVIIDIRVCIRYFVTSYYVILYHVVSVFCSLLHSIVLYFVIMGILG